MRVKAKYLILGLIILLGGFLRLYNLSGSPPSLNWDEAAWGYNAYSVSETLKDEYGKILPIFTRSFDEYKSTLPLYLMIPSIKLFGLNEVGVRFPSAFIGVLTILLIYLLSKTIFKNEKMALAGAFVFSIEPWAVHFARVYHDANIAMFFLLLGLLLFLKSKKKTKLLPFSVLAFMLSMYTYNSNKMLVPIFLGVLVFFNRKTLAKYPKKILKVSLGTVLVFGGVFIALAIVGQVFARVTSTNIFVLWPKTQGIQGLLAKHPLGTLLNFLTHNQYYYFSWEVAGRYLSYFSPYNLFLREPREPATIIAGNSIFHPFEFIPWVFGLIYVFKGSKKYKGFLLLLILSPLPAIVTWNWFQPGRTMALFAVFSILIGVGLVNIVEYFSKILKTVITPRITTGILALSVLIYGFVAAFYLFESINVYLPTRDPGNWQPGFRETVPTVMELAKDYEQVIIETPHAQPYIFFLMYGKYPPGKYLAEVDFDYIGTPRKRYDFGKFKFRKIYWPDDRSLENTLFVGSWENLPQNDIDSTPNARVITEIKNKWGDVIHKLVGTE